MPFSSVIARPTEEIFVMFRRFRLLFIHVQPGLLATDSSRLLKIPRIEQILETDTDDLTGASPVLTEKES